MAAPESDLRGRFRLRSLRCATRKRELQKSRDVNRRDRRCGRPKPPMMPSHWRLDAFGVVSGYIGRRCCAFQNSNCPSTMRRRPCPPRSPRVWAWRRSDIISWSVWKRAHDARKKSAILKVYIVDVEVKDEAAVLARFADDPHVQPTPDIAYRPVAVAPQGRAAAARRDRGRALRPVRRADPGRDGLQADHPRPRQGGARADQGHLGPVAQGRAQPGIQRPVRRGRRGHLFGRQALQPDQGSALPGPQGADRVRRGRRAGGDPDRGAPAHRHLPPGDHGRGHAREDRGAGRRVPLRAPGHGHRAG